MCTKTKQREEHKHYQHSQAKQTPPTKQAIKFPQFFKTKVLTNQNALKYRENGGKWRPRHWRETPSEDYKQFCPQSDIRGMKKLSSPF